MRYAAEVIDLLSAYPGQPFRKRQIVNHIAKGSEKSTVRVAVWRVLKVLQESRQLRVESSSVRGGSSLYSWHL
jgi:hypothetical protein